MSNRRRLARERLEIYLVHLLLMYRRLILIVGLFLLLYSIASLLTDETVGYTVLIPAIFLLLLGNSYNFVVYTARLGAWVATFWSQND